MFGCLCSDWLWLHWGGHGTEMKPLRMAERRNWINLLTTGLAVFVRVCVSRRKTEAIYVRAFRSWQNSWRSSSSVDSSWNVWRCWCCGFLTGTSDWLLCANKFWLVVNICFACLLMSKWLLVECFHGSHTKTQTSNVTSIQTQVYLTMKQREDYKKLNCRHYNPRWSVTSALWSIWFRINDLRRRRLGNI